MTTLAFALAEGQPLWVIGAVRLAVLCGSASVLGATLHAGACVDVVAPPFESAVPVEGALPGDLRLAAAAAATAGGGGGNAAECAALLAALQRRGATGMGGAFRTAVAVSPVPRLGGYLADYDCAAGELDLEWWSRAVRGACLLGTPPGMPPLPRAAGGASTLDVVVGSGGAAPPPPPPPSSTASCRVVARPTVTPYPWRAAVEQLLGHAGQSTGYGVPRVLPQLVVTGPKGAGKSTFVRMATNALLTAADVRADDEEGSSGGGGGAVDGGARLFPCGVAYLDLDVGQPEHTVPGLLSLTLVTAPLLTPPHMRVHASAVVAGVDGAVAAARALGEASPLELFTVPPAAPALGAGIVAASRYVGATSPKADPAGYTAAVAELLAVYRRHLAPLGVPLVVNSHGWIRGVGFATIQAAIDAVCPTHVVHFEADGGLPPPQLQQAQSWVDGGGGSSDRAPAASPSSTLGGGGSDTEGGFDADDGVADVIADVADNDDVPDDGAVAAAAFDDMHGGGDGGERDGDGAGAGTPSARGPQRAQQQGGGRAAASAAPVRLRPPRAPPTEVFTAPPAAYQPWATQGTAAGAAEQPPPPPPRDFASLLAAVHRVGGQQLAALQAGAAASAPPPPAWNSGLGVCVYRLPPWHVAAMGAGQLVAVAGSSSSSSSTGGGKALPPRAARSPADLRAMRLALYLLSGLAAHAPGELAAAAVAAEAREQAGGAGGDDADGASIGDDALVVDGDDDDDADGGAADEPAGGDDDAGDYAAEDGGDGEGGSVDELLLSSDEDAAAGAAAYDGSTPLALQPAPAAGAAYWGLVKRAVRSAFWRVLAEGREARAPITGLASPAFALAAATPVLVPLSDVALVADASQPLALGADGGPAGLGAGNDAAQRHRARCLHGQLVGLCSTRLQTPGLPPGARAVVRPSSLPCVGVGYVAAVDTDAGLLALVTPVPLAALRGGAAGTGAGGVDVLVSWSGPHDLPSSLLYRAHPHGVDAFAVPPHALAPTATATARADTANRKQLKRRRLDGGGGRGGKR